MARSLARVLSLAELSNPLKAVKAITQRMAMIVMVTMSSTNVNPRELRDLRPVSRETGLVLWIFFVLCGCIMGNYIISNGKYSRNDKGCKINLFKNIKLARKHKMC